jgi:hypothetical protein
LLVICANENSSIEASILNFYFSRSSLGTLVVIDALAIGFNQSKHTIKRRMTTL